VGDLVLQNLFCRISVIGKKFAGSTDCIEQWYGTQYACTKLPDDIIQVWSSYNSHVFHFVYFSLFISLKSMQYMIMWKLDKQQTNLVMSTSDRHLLKLVIEVATSITSFKRCQLVFDDHCQTYGNLCQTAVKMPNHCTHPHWPKQTTYTLLCTMASFDLCLVKMINNSWLPQFNFTLSYTLAREHLLAIY